MKTRVSLMPWYAHSDFSTSLLLPPFAPPSLPPLQHTPSPTHSIPTHNAPVSHADGGPLTTISTCVLFARPHEPSPLRTIPPRDGGHHTTLYRQASSRPPTQGWLAPRLWPLQSAQVQIPADCQPCLHDYQAGVVLVLVFCPRNSAILGRFAPRVPSADLRLSSMSLSPDGLRHAAAFLLEVRHCV